MFRAANLTKQLYLKGDTMIFPELLNNIGEGYDPRCGCFVTPLAGTYYFTVQLYIFADMDTDFGIYVNDECIAWAKLRPDNNSCENLSVVVSLKIGDTVYVKQISKVLFNAYLTNQQSFLTHFLVFLFDKLNYSYYSFTLI